MPFGDNLRPKTFLPIKGYDGMPLIGLDYATNFLDMPTWEHLYCQPGLKTRHAAGCRGGCRNFWERGDLGEESNPDSGDSRLPQAKEALPPRSG